MQSILLGLERGVFCRDARLLNALGIGCVKRMASRDASLLLVRMRWPLGVGSIRRMIFPVVANLWEDEGFLKNRKEG